MAERIDIKKKVLSENDRLASEIRSRLRSRGIVAFNLVSSPGSGKTSLLERTLRAMKDEIRIALIAGDVQTENDAERLVRAGGDRVRPLVTGGSCHLDARMISNVLPDIDLADVEVLFIENVGNLVCPSGFDLGEDMKVVVISTTEGDDKPLKYPAMFRRSSVMVVNKIDLLGMSDFSLDDVKRNARSINPEIRIFEVSCRTGEGLGDWYSWLRAQVGSSKSHELETA